MCQINGTDRARDRDEIDLARPGKQNRYISDCHVIEADPYVGCARTAIARTRTRYVLPSGGAILLPHIGQNSGVIHPVSRKPEMVHRNTVYAGNHASKIGVVLVNF